MNSTKSIMLCLIFSIILAFARADYPENDYSYTKDGYDCSNHARNCDTGLECFGPLQNPDNVAENKVYLCADGKFCDEPTYTPL